MADRYQDRPFATDDNLRSGGAQGANHGESDPLAELARLIGQTDPFGTMGRANRPMRSQTPDHDLSPPPDRFAVDRPVDDHDDRYEDPVSSAEIEPAAPAGPPSWMLRNRQATPVAPEPPRSVHPLHRYATPQPVAHEQTSHEARYEEAYDDQAHDDQAYEDQEARDPSRYDHALYGEPDPGLQPEPTYDDEIEAYPDDYSDESYEEAPRARRGWLVTVAMIAVLAVIGMGGACAYRTFMGSSRSGEPPIIKADTSPTKIIPAPSDGPAKVPDRLASGDTGENIVPREEAPVDVTAKSNPRVVFPPLNQNNNPPPAASVATDTPLPTAGGTLPNSEPRKIRTFTVRSDQPDAAATPVSNAPAAAKPTPSAAPKAASTAPAPRPSPAAVNSNAAANGPLSLSPQAQQQPAPATPPTRVAATNPTQIVPSSSSGASYLVQISSQRNEADAQASYRALQGKFPSVLGSRSPVIRRADLGEKGVYYRAMVGPFGSSEEAAQFCSSLKAAGGQCVIQRN